MPHDNIIEKCVEILGITRPYSIRIYSKSKEDADALYIARYSKARKNLTHEIRIYLGDNYRSLETLIVHEFIHAWQEEMGLTENHGKYFKKLAKELGILFDLPDIYLKGIDEK